MRSSLAGPLKCYEMPLLRYFQQIDMLPDQANSEVQKSLCDNEQSGVKKSLMDDH